AQRGDGGSVRIGQRARARERHRYADEHRHAVAARSTVDDRRNLDVRSNVNANVNADKHRASRGAVVERQRRLDPQSVRSVQTRESTLMNARHTFAGRHTVKGFSLAVLLASAAVTGTAHAQPAKPTAAAQDSATAEARARFDEGIKLAEAGDHESARLKFNQAWALLKIPAILYNLARSEQLSNHPVEALEHYRQFAKTPPDPKITDAQRQRVAENIVELSKKVGQIEIEAPPGARISVDGRGIDPGNTDPVPVTPGKHVVEAIADGKVKNVTVECTAGTITKAKLIEDASAAKVAARTAESPTNAETTPPPKEEAPSFWTGGRIAGLGVFVGGLAALGVGVAFHMAAGKAEDDANDIRAQLPEPKTSACLDQANESLCSNLTKKVDDQNMSGDLRTGFLIGGGALLVGGAVLFLVSSPSGSSTRGGARLVPIANGRETGLAVVGRF
ncbi:MAG: hypothetical protein K0S65_868, partial [Labilithrix sp.]|nr:hypothetical protein [Labilithrix sp.]